MTSENHTLFFKDLSENSFSQYKLINHMPLPFYTKWDFLLILCFADGLVSILGEKLLFRSHFLCFSFWILNYFKKYFICLYYLQIKLHSADWCCIGHTKKLLSLSIFIVSYKCGVKRWGRTKKNSDGCGYKFKVSN